MIEFLVEHGADVNAKSTTEETALGKAIGLGLFETSKYLLSKGTNPNVTIQGRSVREFLNGTSRHLNFARRCCLFYQRNKERDDSGGFCSFG
jgi:ankyrin repeat protein